jgi:ammonium transporter Rh
MYALTGSCLTTFIVSSLLGKRLVMEDILNASLAGGVAVGASAGVIYFPAVALAIGLLAGVISTLGFHYITPFLERKIGLYDTCGIHNLHGIPGALGGIISAAIIAAYSGGVDTAYTSQFSTFSMFNNSNANSDYLRQGGLQLAGTFTSLFVGLLAGIATGVVLNMTYNENPGAFFHDSPYFEVGESEDHEHRS